MFFDIFWMVFGARILLWMVNGWNCFSWGARLALLPSTHWDFYQYTARDHLRSQKEMYVTSSNFPIPQTCLKHIRFPIPHSQPQATFPGLNIFCSSKVQLVEFPGFGAGGSSAVGAGAAGGAAGAAPSAGGSEGTGSPTTVGMPLPLWASVEGGASLVCKVA